MDATCTSDSECCSGACDNLCLRPIGQGCDAGNECGSDTCTDDVCACTTPAPDRQTYCALDADCCNGISCQTYVYQGVKYGQCCNPVGGACQGDWDCCDSSCVNGACACLPVEGSCDPGDCCQGACIGSSIYLPNIGVCLNPAGTPCTGPYDCLNSNCVNGSCGSCSASTGGICQSSADCCSGAVCAGEILLIAGGFPPPKGAARSGCWPCPSGGEPGADCDGGENSSACWLGPVLGRGLRLRPHDRAVLRQPELLRWGGMYAARLGRKRLLGLLPDERSVL